MKALKDEQDRKINQIEDEKIKKFNYFTEHDNRNAQRMKHFNDFDRFQV